MGLNKRVKPILIYNLLLKEVTRINKLLPEDRKLSLKERRALISTKIYPKYKNQARGRIRLTPLRTKIVNLIRRMPKRIGCDVLAIDAQIYSGIPYYGCEELIGDILPKCIYVKVTAFDFGETTIFNTRDFDYHKTGLSEITNSINEALREFGTKSDSGNVPEYNGIIELLPKKQNNGNPSNYFLNLVLENAKYAKSHIAKIPEDKRPKKEKRKSVNNYIRDQIKKLKAQKSRFKPIRKRVRNAIHDMESIFRQKFIPKEQKVETVKLIYNDIVKRVKDYYKKEIISEKKFAVINSEINRAYNKFKG